MKLLVLVVFLQLLEIKCQCDQDNDVSVDLSSQEANSSGDSSVECNEHAFEEVSPCNANPYCQRTCENHTEDPDAFPLPCPRSRSCIRGCVCKKDYVRSELHGPCVHFTRCPRVRH
ncbi:uncharacterized protein LOC130671528 [Microplitis mediator]|uniref:uncharacterized protein LOC130671528 n=1 Tax=Microplitis mediator TaxID=375433 RepID=UPI002556D53B|nr:uncharacterized protein LOC130671528 [Microplitis mediator]